MKSSLRFRVTMAVAFAGIGTLAIAGDVPLREQFAYSAPIETPGNAALLRLDVPLEVYRNCIDPGLADLRVLNGSGEIVPFSVRRPPPEARPEVATLHLQLFPLRGDAAASAAALRLDIDGGKTLIELRGAQPGAAPAAAQAYLINASAVGGAIDSLTFMPADDTADFSASVVVQVSDDLANWRVIVPRASLARLSHGGEVFEQRRVEFPATRARFFRLNSERGTELPAFVSVTGTQFVGGVPVERRQYDAMSIPGKAGEYFFDLGAQLPIDRVEMLLPDINTVAQIEIYSRRKPDDPWQNVAHASVYRLTAADGELQSAPVAISAEARRYWRVVVDPRGGGIGRALPRLRAGWLPDQLLFATRGKGPFELVYGSAAAVSAAVPLDLLLPGDRAGGVLFDAVEARVGEARLAGGPSRLLPPPPPRPWRTWLLWAALLAGVATLAALAWNLARQMRVDS